MEIGSESWKTLITIGALKLGIQINSEIVKQFTKYAKELVKWNKKKNITAITDPEEIAVKHFLDSMVLLNLMPDCTVSLLDIGTGGGFPGCVLKILDPSIAVTLIDASRKKINFLKNLTRILGLSDINAVHVRAEDLIVNRPFDVITCRAFASLEKFICLSLPYLKENGILMALKGKEADREIEKLSSFRLCANNNRSMMINDVFTIETKKITLPHLGLQRAVIIFKKI